MNRNPIITTAPAILIMLLLLLAGGCSSSPQQEKYYYTLRYDQTSEKAELIQNEPIDISVWVRSTTISRTYERKQIVLRHFGPRISYLENHLWANELEEKVPELVAKRLEAYHLFTNLRSDFPYSRPDYELVTAITNLEFIQGEENPQAAVSIRFDLRELQGTSVVTTEVDRQIAVYDSNLDSFVQVVNEAILEYTDLFARDVLAHFGLATPVAEEPDSSIEPADNEKRAGYGQLLMPDVFEGAEQPVYTVRDKDGEEKLGRFGTPLSLQAGRYTVLYGSGSGRRQMRRNVAIREGYRTIVDPDYGGLQVEVVTPDGRSVQLAYELFDAATGNHYGTGYSPESVAEWDKEIWVLPVGRYKVTINNRPFNTSLDYAAVYVEKGKGNILTISVEEAEESEQYRVIGGGVIKEPLYADKDEPWILISSVAGNVAGTLNNRESFRDYAAGFNMNGFVQNRLRYDFAPVNFTLLNLVEVGASRSEAGVFEVTRDAVELDSTLVYNFLLNLGFYLNMDVSSHFLDSYYRSADPFSYQKLDAKGNLIGQGSGKEEIRTAPPFLPVEFQEGLGLNLILVKEPRLEASTRFGLGLRQTIYGDSFPKVDSSSDPVILQQQTDEYTTGLEALLQLTTQFLQEVTYNTRFEAYAPFSDLEELALEWSHDLQLSLFRNFTIDYRATLYNTSAASGGNYIASDHAVYLRFSTIYRLSF